MSELDTSRKYLVPTARVNLPDQPDLVHLSLYEWLPGFETWATGIGLCGYSTTQGALPESTEVTCPDCIAYQPSYEEALGRQAGGSASAARWPDDGRDEKARLLEASALLSQWAPELRESHPVLFRKLDALLQLSRPA